ncbi:MAG: DUF971 domain-containing protein [Burkholderiales bacterium]|jgi:DUF971 family protein|nr:DUF971 domain-containing protein [Burkholderiales bacterium]
MPRPTDIVLHRKSRQLEIAFDDGLRARLDCEFLRVFSPSAEVRGHGPGQETLQVGKRDVNITAIEPVGAYAVKLVFDDGHDTGLYSWDWLHQLATEHATLWPAYLARLEAAGASRDPAGTVNLHKLGARRGPAAAVPVAPPTSRRAPTDE